MTDDDESPPRSLGRTTTGGPAPVLAVVGRPNVGKSTLVNRILGRREAVVEDVPGVTRDRVAYDANWSGRRFTVVDTGGWEPDAKGLAAQVAAQAEFAIEAADAVLFVVDATVGATDTDEAVVKVLRRAGKPVVLAANKVDDQRAEADAAAAVVTRPRASRTPSPRCTGGGAATCSTPCSARCRRRRPTASDDAEGGPRRVALLGKPNVGKSSLLNQLAGEERVVVDAVAGTTRRPGRRADRAGRRDLEVRRHRGHPPPGPARPAAPTTTRRCAPSRRWRAPRSRSSWSTRASRSAEQDTRIISMVVEAGRALVIAYNKWDLLDEERRYYLEREIERELVQVPWAPRVNISARTGRHMDRLVPAIETALDGWDTRVPTGRLNAFLGELVAANPHPVRGGKQPRILFATQAGTRPPRFVLFTTGFLEAGYRRFIERRLREEFGFVGTPDRDQRQGAREAQVARCRGQHQRAEASLRCDKVAGPGSDPGRRAVAQLGSALDWGSRGRRFKSCQPDRSALICFRRSVQPARCGSWGAIDSPPSVSRTRSSRQRHLRSRSLG